MAAVRSGRKIRPRKRAQACRLLPIHSRISRAADEMPATELDEPRSPADVCGRARLPGDMARDRDLSNRGFALFPLELSLLPAPS